MKTEILRGMDLLDEKSPGWEEHIELDRLDQGEPTWRENAAGRECGCVLVQVFGDYIEGIDELDVDALDAIEYGFVCGDGWEYDDTVRREYKTLTSWWKRLFRARYRT